MRTPADILALYQERKKFYDPLHQGMAEIAAIYDGDAQVALPDLGRDEPSSVPNLLAQGVDQMAGRIASVVPRSPSPPRSPVIAPPTAVRSPPRTRSPAGGSPIGSP